MVASISAELKKIKVFLSQTKYQPLKSVLYRPRATINQVTFGYSKDEVLFKDLNLGIDFESRVEVMDTIIKGDESKIYIRFSDMA